MQTGRSSSFIQTPFVTITPRGAAFLGAAFALTVAGLLMIDGILISMGVAGFLLIGIVLLFGRWNLNHIRFQLSSPKRVFADTPFDLRLTQHNQRNLFDSCGMDIELRLSKTAKIHTHADTYTYTHNDTHMVQSTLLGVGSLWFERLQPMGQICQNQDYNKRVFF